MKMPDGLSRPHRYPLLKQDEILDAIQQKTALIEQAKNVIYSELDQIREYRVRLIADVVTGNLDVREAAHHLPDLLEDEEDLDDEEDILADEIDEEWDEGED